MPKLLSTLVLILFTTCIAAIVALSMMDAPIDQQKFENTVTYEDFKTKQ